MQGMLRTIPAHRPSPSLVSERFENECSQKQRAPNRKVPPEDEDDANDSNNAADHPEHAPKNRAARTGSISHVP